MLYICPIDILLWDKLDRYVHLQWILQLHFCDRLRYPSCSSRKYTDDPKKQKNLSAVWPVVLWLAITWMHDQYMECGTSNCNSLNLTFTPKAKRGFHILRLAFTEQLLFQTSMMQTTSPQWLCEAPSCQKARMFKVLKEVAENNCSGSRREGSAPCPKIIWV